ncbi:MAG: ATP-binding protein [candidate division KSB1 bacterium]|nr:ATP-binding protein [candidate division KSB1 bacterium]
MEKTELLRVLYRWNPWWEGRPPAVPEFRRDALVSLKNELEENKITALIGPRQTGKTTLMLQLIKDLLEQGTAPQKILYLLIEDVRDALEEKKLSLRDILQTHSEEILHQPLGEGKRYVFWDEIHVYRDWSRSLKVLFDQNIPVKFIISGSASTDLLKGASESLVGRIAPTILLPMRFNEVARFELNKDFHLNGMREIQQTLRSSLEESLGARDPRPFFSVCQEVEKKIIPVEERLRIILQRYLTTGGFPEIVVNRLEFDQAFRRLRDYTDLVLQKDFVRFFGIRDPKSMERILRMIAKNTSRILVERNLAQDLGISVNTVRNYLEFLEDTFLVMSARIYAASLARQIRRPEKFYIVDTGLGNTLVGYGEEDKGNLAETIVCTHLQSLSYEKGWPQEICYWREKEKFEVDLIWEVRGKVLPIEVKYRRAKRLTGINEFLTRYATWGMVISEELRLEGNQIFVPLHLFLLLG